MPRRAVLFDLDGTLLDSNPSIRDTMNAVLAEKGFKGFTKAELDALVGHPLREILATKVPDRGVVEGMAHRYRAIYSQWTWVTVKLFPGLETLLTQLHREGWATGIVTSKGQKEAEVLMADLGLAHLLDVVIGDDDRRPLKPNPDPVLDACRQLGIMPSQAAMVGDTRFDMGAGKSSGAFCVGVLWGNGSREELVASGAHALAKDAGGLHRILSDWQKAEEARPR